MRRTATVVNVGRVTYPPSDYQQVWQVDTDLADRSNRSFYLRCPGPCPTVGQGITWGDHRAWIGQEVARKVGYDFDRDDDTDSPLGHHG